MSDPRPQVVVLGAGGHARVLVDLLRLVSLEPVAVLDRDGAAARGNVLGVPIVGGDEELKRFDPARVALVNAVGSVQINASRRELFLRCRALGFHFATLVHPRSTVAAGATLAEGVQVLAGAVINVGARVAENTIINTAAVVEHDCTIGPHVHVASRAALAGGVTAKEAAFIGAGATVIQGIVIGARAVVGAGAVVIRDVEDDAVVVGVPARTRAGRR